ncbi:MAG: FKBP-type peptidyl-prolyl cis-trans isomerase [Paludibacteraceae bacterium]
MKKIVFTIATLAMMVGGFTSCNSAPKANLETDVDTLTYCYGVTTTRGLKEYLLQLGVDSTQMDAFVRGFVKATGDLSDGDRAEMVGMQIGQQVMQQMMPHFEGVVTAADSNAVFNKDNYLAGFLAGVTGDERVATVAEAALLVEEITQRQTDAKYADWKAENEKWLADNAQKEGVVTTESGLQYEVLKAGNGAKPTAVSRVKVHYRGTTIDDVVFDSSIERGEPAVFGVNQVIKGWTEALQLMPVGSKWRLYIPQELAYGDADQGRIKPYSTLIFDVELIEIMK